MRRFIITASFCVLVFAKPEMYKEKEDFQYSRSSSDEGSKSGFYGAQRGNMGGNYEKAHNMDTLAQHQLSSVVGQVDGELGEGANTRTGSVYTAGNSRGIYGFGNYDISNLRGRSFAEGSSYDDSLSHSLFSQTSGNVGYDSSLSAANIARYSNSQSQSSALNSGYQTSGLRSKYVQTENQQAADRYQGSSNYEQGSQSGKSYKYTNLSGSQGRTEYDQNSANLNRANGYGYNTESRLIYTTPLRIYGRPGTRIAVPVSEHMYDASQSSLIHDQNAISSDAEVLSTSGQQDNYRPSNKGKHYESSYSYHKEWEKHGTQPVTLSSTENPFPKNSELFEDAQSTLTASNLYQGKTDSANSHTSNTNNAYLSEYDDNIKSASSSESKYQSQQQGSGASVVSNSYTHNRGASASLYGSQISDTAANSNNLLESLGSKPKSYHNSYSYHKSWERRGDPYVIKPVGDINNQVSQRLTALDSNSYLCSYCIDNGQQREKRSYNSDQYEQRQNIFNTQEEGQQSLNGYDYDVEKKAANKRFRLQDLGQQTQSQWGKFDELGQQTQNQWNKLEDLGQQTQDQWGKLDDLGKQAQRERDNSENLRQEEHNKTAEDFGQQTENQEDNSKYVGQQIQDQWGKLEDLGQQTQNQWGNLEDLGQQQYNQWNKLEESGQQTHPQWNQLNNLNQQESIFEQQPQQGIVTDLGQQVQNSWNLDQFHQTHQHNFRDNTNNYIFQTNWDQQTNSENIFYHNQDAYNPWNSYSNFDPHPLAYPEIPKEQNSLDNKQQLLWDKINNAFKEDEVSNSFNYHNVNPQLTTDKNLNESPFDNWDYLFNHNLHISNKSKEDTVANSQTVQKYKNDTNRDNKVEDTLSNMSDTDVVQGKELIDVTAHSVDTGRGDIGPEDISIESTYKLKEKSPEELEILSLTTEFNNQNESKTIEEPLVLNVIGLNQRNEFINKEKISSNLSTILESITTTKKPKTGDMKSTSDKEESLTNSNKVNTISLTNDKLYPFIENEKNRGSNQQNIEQLQDNSQYQQDKTLEQHNSSNYVEPLIEETTRQHADQQNFEQQNTDQQLEMFEQQNLGQDLEAFEKQNTDLLTFDEQRLGQQLESFEQQNLGQQLDSLEQLNWGQHSKSLDNTNTDQLETFQHEIPVETFEPQDISHIDTFNKEYSDHKSASFEQQNMHSLDESHLLIGQQSQKPINEYNLQFLQGRFEQYEQIIPNQYSKEQDDDHSSKRVEQPLSNNQKDIPTPVEPTTNKPGFWSSVWNKTKSAKDSVVSWFHN